MTDTVRISLYRAGLCAGRPARRAALIIVRRSDGRKIVEGWVRYPDGVAQPDMRVLSDFPRWLDGLSSSSRAAVLALDPGEHVLEVEIPWRDSLREYLALPPNQRTESEARRRGIGLSYPGSRHHAYPVVSGLDGEDVPVTRG